MLENLTVKSHYQRKQIIKLILKKIHFLVFFNNWLSLLKFKFVLFIVYSQAWISLSNTARKIFSFFSLISKTFELTLKRWCLFFLKFRNANYAQNVCFKMDYLIDVSCLKFFFRFMKWKSGWLYVASLNHAIFFL